MFEAVELGRKVEKAEYEERVPALRTSLLEVQRRLRTSKASIVVIVSGVEGAGKSEVVNRLSGWLDTRGLQTHAFWDETDDERNRPFHWRFWRRLPTRGSIGVMFGSWYTKPIIDCVFQTVDAGAFDTEMRRIAALERMLAADGVLVVKLWFHLSKSVQRKRLEEKDATGKHTKEKGKDKKGKDKKGKDKKGKDKKGKDKKGKDKKGKGRRLSPLVARFCPHYDAFAEVSERAIRLTDSGASPWHLIEAEDSRYRDLAAGQILLDTIQNHLDGLDAKAAGHDAQAAPQAAAEPAPKPGGQPTVLDHVDLSQVLTEEEYRLRIKAARYRLHELSWELRQEKKTFMAAFEGWDASGKGGAIRRLTGAMDARLYRVIPVAAPTDEEQAHHYLWRFWRHVPPRGCVRIFDRSWYGRVLVERVEGFATREAWERSFLEINEFEEQLHEHGIGVAKFWIHIDQAEQLRRFEEREQVAWKKHKITPDDWRNREKWDLYEAAINDMVARTSTSSAPWTLVAGNDKKWARVSIIETICKGIEATLARK